MRDRALVTGLPAECSREPPPACDEARRAATSRGGAPRPPRPPRRPTRGSRSGRQRKRRCIRRTSSSAATSGRSSRSVTSSRRSTASSSPHRSPARAVAARSRTSRSSTDGSTGPGRVPQLERAAQGPDDVASAGAPLEPGGDEQRPDVGLAGHPGGGVVVGQCDHPGRVDRVVTAFERRPEEEGDPLVPRAAVLGVCRRLEELGLQRVVEPVTAVGVDVEHRHASTASSNHPGTSRGVEVALDERDDVRALQRPRRRWPAPSSAAAPRARARARRRAPRPPARRCLLGQRPGARVEPADEQPASGRARPPERRNTSSTSDSWGRRPSTDATSSPVAYRSSGARSSSSKPGSRRTWPSHRCSG